MRAACRRSEAVLTGRPVVIHCARLAIRSRKARRALAGPRHRIACATVVAGGLRGAVAVGSRPARRAGAGAVGLHSPMAAAGHRVREFAMGSRVAGIAGTAAGRAANAMAVAGRRRVAVGAMGEAVVIACALAAGLSGEPHGAGAQTARVAAAMAAARRRGDAVGARRICIIIRRAGTAVASGEARVTLTGPRRSAPAVAFTGALRGAFASGPSPGRRAGAGAVGVRSPVPAAGHRVREFAVGPGVARVAGASAGHVASPMAVAGRRRITVGAIRIAVVVVSAPVTGLSGKPRGAVALAVQCVTAAVGAAGRRREAIGAGRVGVIVRRTGSAVRSCEAHGALTVPVRRIARAMAAARVRRRARTRRARPRRGTGAGPVSSSSPVPAAGDVVGILAQVAGETRVAGALPVAVDSAVAGTLAVNTCVARRVAVSACPIPDAVCAIVIRIILLICIYRALTVAEPIREAARARRDQGVARVVRRAATRAHVGTRSRSPTMVTIWEPLKGIAPGDTSWGCAYVPPDVRVALRRDRQRGKGQANKRLS